jgi:Zn-dependent protease with chaperone function
VVTDDLRARGDRELADKILASHDVRRLIERFEKEVGQLGARRHLLSTAMRMTREMAPGLHAIFDAAGKTLALDAELELYVFPSPVFNAAAVRPEGGRLFVMVSSALLEGFSPEELKFVVGHELAHHLFDHHSIPVGVLLHAAGDLPRGMVLELFAWQRWAEISCDRAGLVCAGGLEASAKALFKLASGLRGDRYQVRVDHFLAQIGDLQEEASKMASADERPRADWFATHPFSPLRVGAIELFSKSSVVTEGGITVGELEARTAELMGVMQPSYLKEKSATAEAMRRLLFAAGIEVALSTGPLTREKRAALEDLLGPGSIPLEVNADAIHADLANRIEAVNDQVPTLRRAQIIRDLVVIARADGDLDDREIDVICKIADEIGVGRDMVSCAVDDAERARRPLRAEPGYHLDGDAGSS